MIVTIEVSQKSISVTMKHGYTMRQCDAQCKIDGELYQYIVKKSVTCSNKFWREQGINHAYYHAKNEGENIVWLNSNAKKSTRKAKVSTSQKTLFGE